MLVSIILFVVIGVSFFLLKEMHIIEWNNHSKFKIAIAIRNQHPDSRSNRQQLKPKIITRNPFVYNLTSAA